MSLFPSTSRGVTSFGWLKSKHTFSFGDYRDPSRMGFGPLRVINEDVVTPGQGFGQHPHSNMEIISYVVSGELEHKDDLGNGSTIRAGEVQIMSAGSGIKHSEFNPSDTEPCHFYQIWIKPSTLDVEPSYQQSSFEGEGLHLIAGGGDAMQINQDAKLYKGSFCGGAESVLDLDELRLGWLQVVSGEVNLNGTLATSGDGVSLEHTKNPKLQFESASEFLFFDLPRVSRARAAA